MNPKIFVDFQNADTQGRLRLNCAGTLDDLKNQQTELRDGLNLILYSDDGDAQGQPDELLVDGVAAFSEEEQIWVAIIDWSTIHHTSDLAGTGPKGSLLKKVI